MLVIATDIEHFQKLWISPPPHPVESDLGIWEYYIQDVLSLQPPNTAVWVSFEKLKLEVWRVGSY